MILQFLSNALGQPNSGYYEGKTKYNYNCPRCAENNDGLSDNKYNLGVLFQDNLQLFHCWKCGYKGKVKTLLRNYGKTEDYNSYIRYNLEYHTVHQKNKKQNYFFTNLPKDFVPFDKFDIKNNAAHKLAYDYLVINRKIPIKTIKFFKIGACFDGFYKGRIIIPSYASNKKLNFFIGRSFIDGVKPTYLHDNIEKTEFIFNESNINWNHPIYLVEGAFDMLSLPINTIPLLGKILLENVLEKIIKNKTYVILILDEDAKKESIEIKKKLDLYNVKNKVIFIKNKDLNNVLSTSIDSKVIKKEVIGYRNLLEE